MKGKVKLVFSGKSITKLFTSAAGRIAALVLVMALVAGLSMTTLALFEANRAKADIAMERYEVFYAQVKGQPSPYLDLAATYTDGTKVTAKVENIRNAHISQGSYQYNEKGENYSGSLFSLDPSRAIGDPSDGKNVWRIGTWEETLLNNADHGAATWVVTNGYPARTLQELRSATGVTLTAAEARIATQAALWNVTRGVQLSASGNSQATIDLYNWFIKNKQPLRENPLAIDSSTAKFENGKYGPFKVSGRSDFTATILLDAASGAEFFVGEEKRGTSTTVAANQDFYIVGADSGVVTINANAETESKLARLLVNYYEPSARQPLIFTSGGAKTAENATVSLQVPVEKTSGIAEQPSLNLIKTGTNFSDSNNDGQKSIGDQVTYEFKVTNTGNVAVSDIAIVDEMLSAANVKVSCTDTELAPGKATRCVADPYTITAADVTQKAGKCSVISKASVSAKSGGEATLGSVVTAEDEYPLEIDCFVKPTPTPSASSTPSASASESVTASAPVTESASAAVSASPTSASPTATPSNTASATPSNTSAAPSAIAEASATETTTASQSQIAQVKPEPGLRIQKIAEVKQSDNNNTTNAGDMISYIFVVTNTGNVSVSDLKVEDSKLGGIAINCDKKVLNAGESTRCVATKAYVITDADAKGCKVVGAAKAKATWSDEALGESGEITSKETTTTTDVVCKTDNKVPDLMLKKGASLQDRNKDGRANQGEIVIFNFEITNNSDTDAHGVKISDPMLEALNIDIDCGGVDTVKARQTITCVAEGYKVTAQDVANGSVRNVAKITHGGGYLSGESKVVIETESIIEEVMELAGTGGMEFPILPLVMAAGGAAAIVIGRRRK